MTVSAAKTKVQRITADGGLYYDDVVFIILYIFILYYLLIFIGFVLENIRNIEIFMLTYLQKLPYLGVFDSCVRT